MFGSGSNIVTRDWHGFCNPRGSVSQVVTGWGTGWETRKTPTRDAGLAGKLAGKSHDCYLNILTFV